MPEIPSSDREEISIIEGPTPIFEPVFEGFPLSLLERGEYAGMTRLRTFNGPAQVEKVYRAYKNKIPIELTFHNKLGLPTSVPIIAARCVETDDGQVLLLWVKIINKIDFSPPGRL